MPQEVMKYCCKQSVYIGNSDNWADSSVLAEAMEEWKQDWINAIVCKTRGRWYWNESQATDVGVIKEISVRKDVYHYAHPVVKIMWLKAPTKTNEKPKASLGSLRLSSVYNVKKYQRCLVPTSSEHKREAKLIKRVDDYYNEV